MRDVLDAPESVRRQFPDESLATLIDSYYDDLLIYGDRRIYDPLLEYGLADSLAAHARFVGYVSSHVNRRDRPRRGRPRVLVAAGGGEDGDPLYHAVLDALRGPLADVDMNVDIVLGPYLAARGTLQTQLPGGPRSARAGARLPAPLRRGAAIR